MKTTPPEKHGNLIQSVARAMDLLNRVAANDDWVGVRELARQANLKVPTAHNLLKTLASKGYLEFDAGTGQYRVGLAVLLLAQRVERLPRLEAFARPYMDRIFQHTQETTVASAMIAGRIVFIDTRQGNQPISVAHYKGLAMEHPHTLASGMLLLSYCDEATRRGYAESEPLDRLGPNVPMTVTELLADFDKTRQQGYSEMLDALGHGIGAVAVPVFGVSGRMELVMACSAPMNRFDKTRRKEILAFLLEVAGEMTAKLGGGQIQTGATDCRATDNKP